MFSHGVLFGWGFPVGKLASQDASRKHEQTGGDMTYQNDIERLCDQVNLGVITADEANVEKVKIRRVQLVTSKIPAQVRKALNAAVKRGSLGHMKKDGRKPEAYYHPTFEYMAHDARRKHESETLKALAGVAARPYED